MTESNLRRLGDTDLMLSPVGLGCLQFSRGSGITGIMWPKLSREQINDIVMTSYYSGVNWFDTAELYGWGESERALSRSLDELSIQINKIVIATKWWPVFRTAGSISSTIEKRLAALNVKSIDLYQIHNSFSFSSIKYEMREMAKLVEQKKIRFVGVSNFSAKAMSEAHKELANYGIKLASNQVNYSLLKRQIEKNGILDTAKELGISLIAYSPLGRGLLTGKFHDNPELIKKRHFIRRHYASLNKHKLNESLQIVNALKRIAEKYRVTPSQVAINWVINANGNTVFAIPGATTASHAKDNAESMNFVLSDKEIEHLNEVSALFI